MKIKNIKYYVLGVMIIANSSIMLSCDSISNKYDKIRNKDFYDFLDENDIVSIDNLEDVPQNYYEVEVTEYDKDLNSNKRIGTHMEKLERIDNVICQAKEFDYDYEVLKIEENNGQYVIDTKVIDNIDERPSGYDYVYSDDYVISNGYRDVLIKYGKVLRRD